MHTYIHTHHTHMYVNICTFCIPRLGPVLQVQTHIFEVISAHCFPMPWLIPGHVTWLINFHVLVGYGGILVASQNCTKSCFIFMTLFLPPPPLSSQFYIKEQKLTLIQVQIMIQGPETEAEQMQALHNAQIFSNGAHMYLEQLFQGCSYFHCIFSQDVFLTESRSRGFPSGAKFLSGSFKRSGWSVSPHILL